MSLLRRFKLNSSSSQPILKRNDAATNSTMSASSPAPLQTYPPCMTSMMMWLREHECWLTEGVFRLSGNNAVMLKVYAQIRARPNAAPNLDVRGFDMHTCACLLKHWLRSLPEPICTHALFDSFLAALDVVLTRNGEGDVCVDAMRLVISSLPAVNRDVLCDVLELLHKIASHSAVNKMHAVNLAIVFGPNLLSQKDVDPIESLITMQQVIQCVELMITNWNELKVELLTAAIAATKPVPSPPTTTTAAPAALFAVAPSMRLPTATRDAIEQLHLESVREIRAIEQEARTVDNAEISLADLPPPNNTTCAATATPTTNNNNATATDEQPTSERTHSKATVAMSTRESAEWDEAPDLVHLRACLRRATLTKSDATSSTTASSPTSSRSQSMSSKARRARADANAAADAVAVAHVRTTVGAMTAEPVVANDAATAPERPVMSPRNLNTMSDDAKQLCLRLGAITPARLAQALQLAGAGKLVDSEVERMAAFATRALATATEQALSGETDLSGKQWLVEQIVASQTATPDREVISAHLDGLVELSAYQLLL